MTKPRLAFIGDPSTTCPWLLHAIARAGVFEAICHDGDAPAELPQARWTFRDAASLLREAEPEGVVIAAPFGERASLARQCLSARAGVLIAGAAGNAGSLRRLAVLAKLADRVLLAAPAILYAPAMLLAQRLLESGKMPPPISASVSIMRRGGARGAPPDDGPVPIDTLFEAVDLVHSLVGPVQSAYATFHDEGALAAALSAGTPARPVSLMAHAGGAADMVGVEIELRAADGSRLRITRGGELECTTAARLHDRHCVNLATADPVVELGYARLLREFAAHLTAGPRSKGIIGPCMSVSLAAEAILASARRGRPMHPTRTRPPRKLESPERVSLAAPAPNPLLP